MSEENKTKDEKYVKDKKEKKVEKEEANKVLDNEFPNDITHTELEKFIYRASELGQNMESMQIQKMVSEYFITKINFSDPLNNQYLLSLLTEFIFYCSNQNSNSLDSIEPKKTIPLNSFENILFKIINNREGDPIDDLLKEIVSLIFVLDEKHEGTSACHNAFDFVRKNWLKSNDTDSIDQRNRCQIVLGVRLLAMLINSRIVPDGLDIDILDPTKFEEPYIRKNQYIAIREILSRAGDQDDKKFTTIPYAFFLEHQKVKELIEILANKIKLRSSYEKLTIYESKMKKNLEKKKKKEKKDKQFTEQVIKYDNMIVIRNDKKIFAIYEFDQWVQCQYILLIPYIYKIRSKFRDVKDGFNITRDFVKIVTLNIKELSWNVRYCYLTMLRSSKELLIRSGAILAEFYIFSENNTNFQTACILTIIKFFEANNNITKERNANIDKLLNFHIKEQSNKEVAPSKEPEISICSLTIKNITIAIKYIINHKEKKDAVFEEYYNYIFKAIPMLTWIIFYLDVKNEKEMSSIRKILTQINSIPVNDGLDYCRIFLDPFFLKIPHLLEKIKKEKKASKTSIFFNKAFHISQNALRNLMNSKDYDDRLFFINMINKLYVSESNSDSNSKADLEFNSDSNSNKENPFIMSLIDLIAYDPVYIVRNEAVKTVLNLLNQTSFSDVFDYILQIFASACLNGKKSLLSLISSIISSLDPFEYEQDKNYIFETYIDDIFEIINNDNRYKDLKIFFRDTLKAIWTLLPEKTQKNNINILEKKQ